MSRKIRGYFRLWARLAMYHRRIANSSGTRSILQKKFPGLDAVVLNSGHARHVHLSSRREPGKGIIAIGRFVRRKGFDTLLDALALLAQRGVRYPTTLVGDGPDAEMLEESIRRLGLCEHVRILKGLSDEEVREQLREHRIFCLLPRKLPDGNVEGFGLVFLEAAAEGLPVIAGNSGGVADTVADNENGFLVDPKSPQEAAEKISLLMTDDALWRQMSNKSFEWAARFDWRNRNPDNELSFLLKPRATRCA